ncbi:hypothetical protein OESDEN_06437 [Oesophagostomum dentatum]|uniref:Uncharacterized protein n=1 Tax=Oesophagostomum dentatum TaxID=61180 RepID=A0A0B1TE80_OESDE|nr:hypothetical protein OESDEN_06437 [Oesophagostomum dentatum]
MLFAAKVFIVFLVVITPVAETKPLYELFNDLIKKQTEIKAQQLMQFINKAVPYGLDPPDPKLAEYETFNSDKTANFLHDGNGKLVFREFRRSYNDVAALASNGFTRLGEKGF